MKTVRATPFSYSQMYAALHQKWADKTRNEPEQFNKCVSRPSVSTLQTTEQGTCQAKKQASFGWYNIQARCQMKSRKSNLKKTD